MSKNRATQIDHRLETLESRSLLSAGVNDQMPDAAGQPADVVVADEGFLNGASDSSAQPDNSAGVDLGDAAMYDFGSAAGADQTPATYVDLGGWAVDQDPGHPMMGRTPADVAGVVVQNFGHAADYAGQTPVITQNDAPVGADEPMATEAADASGAGLAAGESPTQSPLAITVADPSGEPGIVWLEVSDAGLKTAKLGAIAEQVVIASTFVGG
jgi:hypothetical protein